MRSRQLTTDGVLEAAGMIVQSTGQLLEALGRAGSTRVRVAGTLTEVPSITLAPGQSLESVHAQARLQFAPGVDGVRLTRDNRVQGIALIASPDRRAICNDASQEDAGRLHLHDLQLQGQLQIIACGALRRAQINIEKVFVGAADTRACSEVASGNGVTVLQGAITVWNQQVDANSKLLCALRDIRIGSRDSPVCGGGVFLSGSGTPGAGRLELERVELHSVYADSGLPEGTTHLVAAAVFVLHNARAKRVHCRGIVETFGPNCVALDNWGEVGEWLADADVRTHGASAVAIVNAGELGRLYVAGTVQTFGHGARCVSLYSDTNTMEFNRLCTRGDGATAVQVTRRLQQLAVSNGIETYGGSGAALVKGVVATLTADCIDIEAGGRIEKLRIGGPVVAHAKGMMAFRTHE